jgi:hypothetical protein
VDAEHPLAEAPNEWPLGMLVYPHWSAHSPQGKALSAVEIPQLAVSHSTLKGLGLQDQRRPYFVRSAPILEALCNELAFSEVVEGM